MREPSKIKSDTQTIVERLKYYFRNSDLEQSSISLEGDTILVKFKYPICPTTKQLKTIKNIVFWTDTLDVPYIDDLVFFCLETNTLSINIKNYDIISGLYKRMKEFGVSVKSFDVSENDICFCYTLSGRNPFNCDELDEFQNIINPDIKNHDSIRIVGFDGVYSFRVNLKRHQ